MITLQEWLRDVYYDEYGTYLWAKDSEYYNQTIAIAEVRGWGAIQNKFSTIEEAEKFQDEVGKFIADAINEKIERLTKQQDNEK
jgi:hypothetical protein